MAYDFCAEISTYFGGNNVNGNFRAIAYAVAAVSAHGHASTKTHGVAAFTYVAYVSECST